MSLTEKNIKERLEEYSQTRDMALRNEIVEHYLYVVDILVKKYRIVNRNCGFPYGQLSTPSAQRQPPQAGWVLPMQSS